MNKYFRKVLESLKTNKDIKALGFSRKELKGVAANVADKLKLEDDSTDDDVSEAIGNAIDDVLPLLKLTQSAVDRQVQEYKRSNDDDDPDDDDDDDEEPTRKSPSKKNRKSKKDGDEENSATLVAIQKLTEAVTSLQGDVTALKSGKTTDSRRAKVEKLLSNTGKFGERKLKSFDRISFKDDEDFEDYLEELKEEIEEENQDRANHGLEKLGNIPSPDKNKKSEKDEELMSDDDVKKLAQM